jgi:acid phosphatase
LLPTGRPSTRTALALALALALVVLVVAGCAVVALALPDRDEPQERVTLGPRDVDSFTAPHVTGSPPITKTLVVVIENHNVRQMDRQMSYLRRLSHEYAYADDYTAVRHPSLPNYLAILGGSTFGVRDDQGPAQHPVAGPSVFGEALSAGGSAKAYLDEMPARCGLGNQDTYAVRHNPWTYFASERTVCRRFDVRVDSARHGPLVSDIRTGQLPTVGLLVPDTCNDAHDPGCTLRRADRWLQAWLPQVLDGPDFRSGHLAVVVTADEDDRHLGNHVLTVVAAAGLHGTVAAGALSHFSLSGFLSDVAGVPRLRQARSAPGFAAAFGLTVRAPTPGRQAGG